MNFKDRTSFLSGFLVIALGGALFYALKPYAPQHLFSETTSGQNIVVDSLMLQAMNEQEGEESLAVDSATSISKRPEAAKSSVPPKEPIVYTPARLMKVSDFEFNTTRQLDTAGLLVLPEPIKFQGYDGAAHLQRFYKKLQEVSKDSSKSVRIAYYGDSMIDGDLIVQDLRSAFQDRFGGRGVGFVSIDSESSRSRYSVKHKVSGNWKQLNYMKSVSDSLNYGVNGAVFYAVDSTSRVSFKASGIKNAYRLNQPVLFYGKGNDSAQLRYTIEKDSVAQSKALDGSRDLNTLLLSNGALKSLDLDFSGATGVPLYGVAFFNNEGVVIDGFSNRGNSGLPLSLLKANFIKRFNKELDYDLVVLQFGANVLSTESKSFNWYSRRMTRVIEHIKLLYPEADILILGTADKGSKKEDHIQTDTTVVRLLRSQQEYAAATGSGFLSLFHLMGGINSMPAWRDHHLANADFTHFSPQGSRKIGRLIFKEIMTGYEAYLISQPSETEEKNNPIETTPTEAQEKQVPQDSTKQEFQ